MSLVRAAFCPVCGMSHGAEVTETVEGKPWMVLARRNYWEKTKEFDPDKPFGVIQESLGRGTFTLIGYFEPEQDVDGYFPLVKRRMLQAMKEWIDKGWITRNELEEVLA